MNLKYATKEQLKEIFLDPVLFSTEVLGLPPVSETEEKILRSKSKRICIAAGRRWGKTTMLAIFSIWYALTQMKGRGDIVCFGPAWEQCEIYMDAVRDCIDLIDPQVKHLIKISINKKRQIKINNCNIYSRSARKTSSAIRGHGRNVQLLIRDEDAFIPDNMMKTIRPVRLSNNAKEIVASTTAGHNHFYKDFNSKVYESYRVTTYDNKFIDKKELDAEKELLTRSEFDQEYMANFIDDRYSVFPQILIDAATDFNRKQMELADDNTDYFMGVDLGRRRDATVICVGHGDQNHVVVDFIKEIVYLEDGMYWKHVIDEIESIVKKFHVNTIHIDQTGIGDKPTEDLRNTLISQSIMCDVKGIDFTTRIKNSRTGLVNSLLLKFERREIHFPFCEKLTRQLKNIRFETSDSPSAKTGTYGTFTHIGHDDYVSALMLFLNALPSATGELFYTRGEDLPNIEHHEDPFQQPQLIITNQDNF